MRSWSRSILMTAALVMPTMAGEPERSGRATIQKTAALRHGVDQARSLRVRRADVMRMTPAEQAHLSEQLDDGDLGGTVSAVGAGNDGFWTNTTFTWGFEPEEGFVTGLIDGQPGYADASLNWAISNAASSTIEASARIGEGNAFSGIGKLQLGHDPALAPTDPGTFGRVIDARVPSGAIANNRDPFASIQQPFTVSAEVFIERNSESGFLSFYTLSNTQGAISTRTTWSAVYGELYVWGELGSFTPTGYYWTPGEYQNYTLEFDPCLNVIRYYLDGVLFFCSGAWDVNGDGIGDGCEQRTCSRDSGNPRAFCTTNTDCLPGDSGPGQCVDWPVGGGVFFGSLLDQIWVASGNAPDSEVSIDDVTIVRGPECASTCGNGIRELGEECEFDENCAMTEACNECICDPCPAAPALPDGKSVWPEGGSAGWYTWTSSADAYAVDTCNTPSDGAGPDTWLTVLEGSCESYTILGSNDDCSSYPGFGDGADPAGRCFDNYNNQTYPGFYPACLCVSTVPGRNYFVVEETGAIANSDLVINLEPRSSCGELGSCCDSSPGSGGACTVTTLDECLGDFLTWTSGNLAPLSDDGQGGLLCSTAVECLEVTGACCDAITGGCRETTLNDCDGARESFQGGATVCGTCPPPVTGACCDRSTTTCTEGVSRPACNSAFEWVEGATCEEIDCVFLAIPTVSTWGLLALALSLLILAKMGSIRAARAG